VARPAKDKSAPPHVGFAGGVRIVTRIAGRRKTLLEIHRPDLRGMLPDEIDHGGRVLESVGMMFDTGFTNEGERNTAGGWGGTRWGEQPAVRREGTVGRVIWGDSRTTLLLGYKPPARIR